MSNTNDEKEVAIIQEPTTISLQAFATDTSDQDDKVSVDPSGERYIRSLSEDELAD